jgi:hypothetical protein
MKPNETSSDLEKLAVRVHMLIEPTGATVTWNEHIPDPDTNRLRQIDGIIERDGNKIHIECRDHQSPQDVMWIEELIGRRISLQADGIIGVSLSGFTKPAKIKAQAKGVILRTFSEMTDAEIESWGKSADLITNYIDISELEIKVFIDGAQSSHISTQPRLGITGTTASPEFLILQTLMDQSGDSFFLDRSTNITAKINLPNFIVDGVPIIDCAVKLRGRLRQEKVNVVGVWDYHGLEPTALTEAVVSKHGTGSTEIIQKGDAATMMLDLSSIDPPINCFLYTYQVDFGRVVKARIEAVGAPHRITFTIDTILDVQTVSP